MKWFFFLLTLPALGQVQSEKFHFGDNARWADPDFDDSAWIDSSAPIDIYAHLLDTFSWVRLKVVVPDRALQPVIGSAAPVVQVFVEGRLIGASGNPPPAFRDARSGYKVWSLPQELAKPGQTVTVAVRMWKAPGLDLRRLTARALSDQFRVFVHPRGETPIYERRQSANFRGQAWALTIMLALLLFLLTAGRVQWARDEFKLLIGYVFVVALGIHLPFVSGWIFPWGNRSFVVNALFQGIAAAMQLELIAWVAEVRRAWWLRVVQSLGIFFSCAIALAHSMTVAPRWLPALAWPYAAGFALSLLAIIVILSIQKSRGVVQRLLPLGLAAASVGTTGTRWLPSLGLPGGFMLGDVYFSSLVLGNILFAVVLVALRVRRLKEGGEVGVQLQAQFEAARGVQEMLLTRHAPDTPGYEIDPVYFPAGEVGGDFFRILSVPGGSTLLLVGDVSGKGLKAAMMVSVIVGILLNRRSSEPSVVLSEISDAIQGQMEGGFVTCCAVLLAPGGVVRIASAGHLPPYLDGVEFELPAELPLGIFCGAVYQTVEFRLVSGQQLTLLSDGVVEAENTREELFGFDRARQISERSASEIAAAAKAWGQNDDITVVTVRRQT